MEVFLVGENGWWFNVHFQNNTKPAVNKKKKKEEDLIAKYNMSPNINSSKVLSIEK